MKTLLNFFLVAWCLIAIENFILPVALIFCAKLPGALKILPILPGALCVPPPGSKFDQFQQEPVVCDLIKRLAEIHDKYSIRYLDKIKRNSLVDVVKNAIIEGLPSGKISDEYVANKLNISSRTLQRKLNKKKTSFRSILKEVRQDIAKYYIHESTVNLMEIAFILGYSEYTSFSRAYKTWTGNSPGLAKK